MAELDEETRGQRAYRRRLENERERRQEAERLGRAEARAEAAERDAAPRPAARAGGPSLPSTGRVTSGASEAASGAVAGTAVSKVQARKLVLVMVFLLFALNVYHEQRGDNKVGFFRRLWATGVVALFLSLVADFAPQVAGPLALVVVLSQVPSKGNDVLNTTLGRLSGTSGTAASTAHPTRAGGESPGGPGR